MAVTTSYPGVYVQELASPVHTITGVATSIALFVGRTAQGPIDQPLVCTSYSDFVQKYSDDTSFSDIPRAVNLFFLNGGTICYVQRIANGGVAASVALNGEDTTQKLVANAKSVGKAGSNIRVAISYNTQSPESTFNMKVFIWTVDSGGNRVMSSAENWTELSMDPNNSRYAVNYVSQNSKLITLTKGSSVAQGTGYSQSGRVFASAATLQALVTPAVVGTPMNVMIKYGTGPAQPVDLSLAIPIASGNFINDIATTINTQLGLAAGTITASELAVGTGFYLKIQAAANFDISILRASTNDVSVLLMLGTAQGGVEASSWAGARPAANGIIFRINDLPDFAQRKQDDITGISVNSSPSIVLLPQLETVSAASLMFTDNYSSSANGNNDGVREKWAIIAQTINNSAISGNAGAPFNWRAEVWGSRLAIMPTAGADNFVNTLLLSSVSTPAGIQSDFLINNRFFMLGAGADGNPPAITDYNTAFNTIIDKQLDLFNLLILPPDNGSGATPVQNVYPIASSFCQKRRAVLLMDPPTTQAWQTAQDAVDLSKGVNTLRMGLVNDYSAIYFPRVLVNEGGANVAVGPAGAVAGVMARIDGSRGVWKAPAGTEANIIGISGLEFKFNDGDNGLTNQRGVNMLRIFPDGIVSWGARTLDGDDNFGSQWKYIPVRRTALFIEESLYRGLKWAVFEPNDEPLWAMIRLNVGAFMHNMFRLGAFQGQTREAAYFVKCDGDTTTQNDIDLGQVNIVVGFAPLKPAEFIILYLQQMAGNIQV